jgi:AAA family ATP:ADP antiporter
MIAIGATAGAAAGSWLTEVLLQSGLVRTEWLLMVALIPLTLSMLLTYAVDQRRPQPAQADPVAPQAEAKAGRNALMLVLSSRFLVAVGIITLLLSWVNTNGENLLFRVLQEFLKGEALAQGIADANALLHYTRDATTRFYGNFFFWVNLTALLLQAFVASRLLKYGGFGALLLMMPLIALFSYSAMALVPVLFIVKIMKIAENATDYSINNTARHVLWLPLSAEVKYKGKPTIDTLFVRVGDGVAALTVLVGVGVLALPTPYFFVLNVALVLVWIAFALIVIGQHRRLSQAPCSAI